MKRLLFMAMLIAFTSCGTQKASLAEIANAKPVILYKTTTDFLDKNPMSLDASIIIKNESDQHITVKSIIDPKSGLKIDRGISAWTLEYNGDYYFNLGYSMDLNHWKSYAKLDIEGTLCAVIIDENSPNILKTNGTSYGGGLTGVLIGESSKWGKNWKDENGNKKKILFIDTRNVLPQIMGRNSGSLGDYLTRKQLKKLIIEHEIRVDTDEIKDIMFEQVLEIIKTINSRKK